MSTRDSSLEVKNALLQQKVASQRAQIVALQRALQSFTQPLNNDGDDDILEEEANENKEDEKKDDEEEEEELDNDQGPDAAATDSPTVAQWDEYEQFYRCSHQGQKPPGADTYGGALEMP
ncbi:hypothetical protein C8J56DRAFT_1056631 [Mycena floridula]|nr:hypothetical protein C8J56DRAFT_1056631 [Mycena floridula]